jgi:hypothetical protein
LRSDDDPAATRLKRLQQAMIAGGGETAEGSNADRRSVIAAMAPIPGPDWMAVVEEPIAGLSHRCGPHYGGPDFCCWPALFSLQSSAICWRGG